MRENKANKYLEDYFFREVLNLHGNEAVVGDNMQVLLRLFKNKVPQ